MFIPKRHLNAANQILAHGINGNLLIFYLMGNDHISDRIEDSNLFKFRIRKLSCFKLFQKPSMGSDGRSRDMKLIFIISDKFYFFRLASA